ncbi:MAG: DUF2252 family protein [Bryobacteraceae bacterium]|nr:DUF2252 family protein [Bryobacteraceae bacterium]
MLITGIEEREPDRTEEFTAYAAHCAKGSVTMPPAALDRHERRLYIRRTLREDHQQRIRNRPEGTQAKFDKLARSPFTFFRGTALLWYRDLAGTDGYLPTVFVVGDVHPENFGVSANENGAPFFGINDFDEAYFAPFSWDVKRCATGFNLVARERGIHKPARKKLVKGFVEGYLRGLREFARNDRERWHEMRADNSPPLIRGLIESVQTSRRDFLASMIDFEKGRFHPSGDVIPHSKHRSEFQKVIDEYCRVLDLGEEARGAHFKVKDVAVKTGSGTASLGLDRYLVLIDGETKDPTDDVLLEIKQSRRSALHGLTPPVPEDQQAKAPAPQGNGTKRSRKNRSPRAASGAADRVVYAKRIHLSGGDPYYGEVSMGGESFLVRELSPYKGRLDLKTLSSTELGEYADICGVTLAQVHARSDEDTGVMRGQAETRILQSIRPALFCGDIARFAEHAARRVEHDYALFRKDHSKGAFNFVSAVDEL